MRPIKVRWRAVVIVAVPLLLLYCGYLFIKKTVAAWTDSADGDSSAAWAKHSDWLLINYLGGWRWTGLFALLLILLYTFSAKSVIKGHPSCYTGYQTEKALRSLSQYCNEPFKPTTGSEGDVPIKSADGENPFQLESVQVVIRHGDRYLLHEIPNYVHTPVNCKVDGDIIESVSEMEEFLNVMKANVKRGARKEQQTFHGWDLYPNERFCKASLLTPEGAAQHVKNGQFLKSVYINEHKLLSDDNYEKQVLIRSTSKSRTFQSAMAFMYGLLPAFDVSKLEIERATNNSMCVESTKHTCSCPAVVKFADVFSSNFRQSSPEMMSKKNVKGVYAHFAEVFGVGAGSLPPPSHIFDVTMVHFCHYTFSPGARSRCIAPWAIRELHDAVQENGVQRVKTKAFQRICKLKMQPLMYEIANRMKNYHQDPSPLKFILYSGHDTTVQPLATALGISDGQWPMYASRIVFEMYSRVDNVGVKKYYLRVLFNGKLMTHKVSFCKGKLVDYDFEMCPIEHFLDFVNQGNLNDLGESNFEEACSKHITHFDTVTE